MPALTFESVNRAIVDAFPELRDAYSKEFDRWGKGEPGQYLVFGFLFDPLLRNLLASNQDPAMLRRVFQFLERMARSDDIEVVNLLQVGELEFLTNEPELLSRAWNYMGEKTKALTRETARIWKCEQNLPEAG